MASFSKNFNFNLGKESSKKKKKSYDRHAYESGDEKSLSLAMSRKKKIGR